MMLKVLYNLVLYLSLPWLPLRLLWRSVKNPDYRANLCERFALYRTPALREAICIHAVSVGETMAALELIRSLLQCYPTQRLVVTNLTPTGRALVRAKFGDQVQSLYLPYDYPWAIRRFLLHLNPKLLLMMESELWPNLLQQASQWGIPIVLANARLSQRSYRRYRWIKNGARQLLSHLTVIMAQSKLDRERFLQLGVAADRVTISGNMKFDLAPSAEILTKAVALRQQLGAQRPIWVAASTHPGEEEQVLNAAKLVLAQSPTALLVIAPRHPERFNEVYNGCCAAGFKVMRYSCLTATSAAINVLLFDVMGELLTLYGACDLAFVGGSLVPWGGHNLLEPAALAKPVLTGPYLSAFQEISQLLLEAGGLLVVQDVGALAQQVTRLLADPPLGIELGVQALGVVEKHRGATARVLSGVQQLLAGN